MLTWDTYGLFESLLQDFEMHLDRARHVRSSHPPGTQQTHVAVSGFLLFSPPEAWGREEFECITTRVQGALSLEALEWYEEAAPAIQMFDCLAMGAMLGKYAAGTLDNVGLLLGEAHLAGFLLERNVPIHERYSSWLSRSSASA